MGAFPQAIGGGHAVPVHARFQSQGVLVANLGTAPAIPQGQAQLVQRGGLVAIAVNTITRGVLHRTPAQAHGPGVGRADDLKPFRGGQRGPSWGLEPEGVRGGGPPLCFDPGPALAPIDEQRFRAQIRGLGDAVEVLRGRVHGPKQRADGGKEAEQREEHQGSHGARVAQQPSPGVGPIGKGGTHQHRRCVLCAERGEIFRSGRIGSHARRTRGSIRP